MKHSSAPDPTNWWSKFVGAVFVLILAVPMLAAALTTYGVPTDIAEPTRPVANDPGKKSGEEMYVAPGNELDSFKKETEFYVEPDAASKLASVYTEALRQSVEDKNDKACTKGLATYRIKLQEAPKQVVDGVKAYGNVPANHETLHPAYTAWVCMTALGISQMSGLTPDSTENIEYTFKYSTTLANKGDYKGCYDVMRHDYVGFYNMLDLGTRIWVGYTMLALPAELTNQHLADFCSYKLPPTTKSV